MPVLRATVRRSCLMRRPAACLKTSTKDTTIWSGWRRQPTTGHSIEQEPVSVPEFTTPMKKARASDVCVLASGGIDSTACLKFYLSRGHNVLPLFVRYGQPACAAEGRSIRAVCNHFGVRPRVVTVRGFDKLSSGEICGRNLFLISVALMATHGLTNIISMGIHGGTRYYDCGADFAQRCQTMISSYTDGRVAFGTPFLNWSKQEIFKYCAESEVPIDITWSCEANNEKPCGKCLSCRDRERLLARA